MTEKTRLWKFRVKGRAELYQDWADHHVTGATTFVETPSHTVFVFSHEPDFIAFGARFETDEVSDPAPIESAYIQSPYSYQIPSSQQQAFAQNYYQQYSGVSTQYLTGANQQITPTTRQWATKI